MRKESDVQKEAVPCSWMWKMSFGQQGEEGRDRDRKDSLL